MPARRGDRVAPPPAAGQWEVLFATNDAAKGWAVLSAQAPGNTYEAWVLMRTDPLATARTSRHHRLRGIRATGNYRGRPLSRWQIEVTAAGRIWYLVDEKAHKVLIQLASPGHPKQTE